MILYAEHLISLLKILHEISLYIRYNSESLKCPLNTPDLFSRCTHIFSLAPSDCSSPRSSHQLFLLSESISLPRSLLTWIPFLLQGSGRSGLSDCMLVLLQRPLHSPVGTLNPTGLSLKLWDLVKEPRVGGSNRQLLADGNQMEKCPASTEGRQFWGAFHVVPLGIPSQIEIPLSTGVASLITHPISIPLLFVSFFLLPFSFPASPSQMNYLHPKPHLRTCLWENSEEDKVLMKISPKGSSLISELRGCHLNIE